MGDVLPRTLIDAALRRRRRALRKAYRLRMRDLRRTDPRQWRERP